METKLATQIFDLRDQCIGNKGSQVPSPTSTLVFSMKDLWAQYPRATTLIKKHLKEKIEADKQIIQEHKDLKEKLTNELWKRVALVDLDFCVALAYSVARKDWIDEEDRWVEDRLKENERLWFHWFAKGSDDGDFKEKIQRAKAFPIENLVKVNGMGVSICPLHSEKTGSFKVYRKQNRWHCFGACGRGGDVLDLVMLMDNCSLKVAVEKLC